MPVAEECVIHKVEGKSNEGELYVEPRSTMEPKRVSSIQLKILKLCDGSRSVREISTLVHERSESKRILDQVIEECARFLADR